MKRNLELTFQKQFSVLLCLGAVMLSGCTLAHVIKGDEGTDITPIKPGMTQVEAERILGPANRDWQTPSGVRYRVYTYYAGTRFKTGYIASHAFMDISTFGLWELLQLSDFSASNIRHHEQKQEGRVAISFNSGDLILGIFPDFSDFDALPADGLDRAHTLKESP